MVVYEMNFIITVSSGELAPLNVKVGTTGLLDTKIKINDRDFTREELARAIHAKIHGFLSGSMEDLK